MIQTYALIENGLIGNVIDITETVARDTFPEAIFIDNHDPMPGIGWSYENGVFLSLIHI